MTSGAIIIPENLSGKKLKVVTTSFTNEGAPPIIDNSKLSTKFDHTGKSCINNGALSGSISQGVQSITYGVPSIAYGNENVTYTNYSIAEGEYTQAGTRSFRVVSGDLLEKSWTLKNVKGIQLGMMYSVRLLANYDMLGKVLSIDYEQSKIYVDGMPWTSRKTENLSDDFLSAEPYWMPEGNGLRGHPSNVNSEYGLANSYPPGMCFSDAINQLTDFNTLWIVGHPELGDISSFSTGCHTEGYGSIAQKQWSHAEGVETVAAGKYSHTEGMYTYAGYSAHAEGISSVAAVLGSHAEGVATSCFGYHSHVGGRRSLVPRDQQYVYAWNGANGTYESHGTGTFNVNPAGGANGFYIGENTLLDLITNETRSFVGNIVDTAIENILRTVMNPTDEEGLDRIWKGAIFEMNDEGKKRVFYSDLSGLSHDGTWYAFPFWHRSPEVDNNPKAYLVGISKLDPRISCVGQILAVDTPEGETILQCGFNSCKKLEFANLENISRLYTWAFSTCVKLSSINVPNLKQIDDHCFVKCRNLSSIALPSVTRINNNAFDECHEGFKIDFSGKTDGIVPTIFEGTLSSAPAGMQIIVPPEMLDKWKAAPYWSDYASSIIAAE